MNPVAEKLLRILDLEEQRDYKNDAVIGGLDKLAGHWLKEAAEAYPSTDKQALVRQVGDLLTAYPGRSTSEGRIETIRAIRKIVARLESKGAETPPTPLPTSARPAPTSAPPAPPREAPRGGLGLNAPVTRLVGINAGYAEKLEKLGVRTIRDLLMLFPRRYDDYSSIRPIGTLRPGEQVTVLGQIWDVQSRTSQRGMHITTVTLADGSGTIQATWFNQPYLDKQFQQGRSIILSGKTDVYLGHLVMQSPEWELSNGEAIHTARLVPIYPLTEGISPRWLRRVQKRTVDYWAPRLPDPLPEDVRREANLADLPTAIAQIHFPDDTAKLEQARRRLCFDEFLVIQLGVLRQRRKWRQQAGRPLRVNPQTVEAFVQSLPFELTQAQSRAIEEILRDIAQPQPMSRLLQGDVGSGKTVVALTGMLVAALDNGAQAALMAPTEILAEQHYRTITRILEASGIGRDTLTVRLLIGSLSNGEKERVRQEIQQGTANLIIGTHALIQGPVAFRDLAFVVIDEQHRFGVMQRATLRDKGFNPHMLVMSATPIPRSLALTLYGDLDISVIDEMPPGRQQIKTYWLPQRDRERAYTFLRKQIEEGRQAFIICPLIEESEALDVKAAVEEHRRLQTDVFPDLRLGLLHGRMRADDKDEVMRRFREGEYHILVSTSVVEVGIDIPNATVILVEGADRFGLAQLHQFRGRVGRGEHQSYCILISDSATPESQERLHAIEQIHDGFKLAEKDLELRGPGEFFGTRQSGLPDLRLAKLSDTRLLEEARRQALRIFERDPDLTSPEHALLAQQVREFWQHKGDLS